ncbi:hypothetical protein OESDEN_01641 [Oesophagostomum dentatum]|uniref:Tudor domain-containing protein n=1 Tax=Oesophagostomum dentatum TaxID=61180 RepID=A0A0B1TLD3_OESDE|nr:hypothetical protein OESDEN_01641 [Oesophagostomum dentatum]
MLINTDEEYLINVEGAQTQSPYEFYARPIRRKRVRVAPNEFDNGEEEQLQSETEAMLNAHNELRKRATDLDTFYSIEDNRSPLESNEWSVVPCLRRLGHAVQSSCDFSANWLKANLRVFAICACSEERAAYTGEWQRVEVLSCNDFANVLFLDSGGTELVVPHSLYKIHPTHCTYPPMCMQLCMHGVGPSTADGSLEWSEGAKAEWRRLLREDLPMSISVLSKFLCVKVLPVIAEFQFGVPQLLFKNTRNETALEN